MSVAAPASPAAGLRRRERWLFAVLVALPIAVLWAFPHFPSQDGPIHLEIATVLRRLASPSPGAFGRFFAVNPEPEPNWFVYLPLAGLLSFLPPLAAEKVLLSGYFLLFPAGFLYAVKGVRPGAAWLAFLGLPLVASYPLHMGFYNFCYSLAMLFFALGWWFRRRDRMGLAATAGLAALLAAVGLAHPVSLAVAGLVVGALAGGDALAAPPGERLRTALRRLGPPLLAALPALAVLALFLGGHGGRETERLPLAVLVRHLASLYSLVSYSRAELVVSLALLVLLALLALGAVSAVLASGELGGSAPSSRRWNGLLAAAGAVLVLYFAAPVGLAGGGYLNQRLQLYLPILFVLWLASRAVLDRRRALVTAAAALLAVALLTLHAAAYRRLDAGLAEYLSVAPRLAPGSTLLGLSFAHHGRGPGGERLALRIAPFQHAAGDLTALREVVDLTSYQADRGYFPVVYRPECNPYGKLGSIDEIEEEPPRVDLARYRRELARAGCGDVDYVLLWDPPSPPPAAARALFAELAAGYDLVAVTAPRGLGRLYRRRG